MSDKDELESTEKEELKEEIRFLKDENQHHKKELESLRDENDDLRDELYELQNEIEHEESERILEAQENADQMIEVIKDYLVDLGYSSRVHPMFVKCDALKRLLIPLQYDLGEI